MAISFFMFIFFQRKVWFIKVSRSNFSTTLKFINTLLFLYDMAFQRGDLSKILLKLRRLTKKDEAWVIREEKEVEDLRQMVAEILMLQRYLQQKRYDKAAQHSEEKLFKEVTREDRRLSRVEYRMNRVTQRLLGFLRELLLVEKQLGKYDDVKNINGSIEKIMVFQRDTLKKVARGGQLQQYIERQQWSDVKRLIDEVLTELQGMFMIIQKLEEQENTIEKSETQEAMGHFQDLGKETLEMDMQIAQFFTRWLQNVFQVSFPVKAVFNNIQYVKEDGHGRMGGGSLFFLERRYLIPPHLCDEYLQSVLQHTFHFETFDYYYGKTGKFKPHLAKEGFADPQKKRKIFEFVLKYRIENGLGFSIDPRLLEREVQQQKIRLGIEKNKVGWQSIIRFPGEKDQFYGEYEQNCNKALLERMRQEYQALQKRMNFP